MGRGRGDDFERRRDRPGRGGRRDRDDFGGGAEGLSGGREGGGRRDRMDDRGGGGDDLRDRMRERFDRVEERMDRIEERLSRLEGQQ